MFEGGATAFEQKAFAHRVDDQRSVSMFQVLISRQTLLCCTQGCVCLKWHLVACPMVVSFFFCHSHWGWRDRLSTSPSPAASSTTSAGTSEEEGLHTCPLPNILEMAFFLVSGDFGGGRIGTSPFLLTMPVSTSEEEGQALLLTMSASTSQEEGQAFLVAPMV